MNFSDMHLFGPKFLAVVASKPYAATAGTTPDNVEQNGQTIDRLAAGRGLYTSAMLVISYACVLNTAETITLAANGQMGTDSSFSSSPVDMTANRAYQVSADGAVTALTLTSGAIAATTLETAVTAGGVVVMEFDLIGVTQYIRSQITTNMSRANTDTSLASAVWIFGGVQNVPAV